MNEKEIRRCRVQVLGRTTGTPCGWGVVISPRRILTCTHVIDDALAGTGDGAVTVRFPALAEQPEREAALTDTRFPTLPPHLASSDIAVLELAEGAMPAEVVVARACSDSFDSSVELFGYALRAGLEPGHAIRGKKQDSLRDHRIDFAAEQPDLVTRSGASGTPLFIEARGMVGIVVAAQAQQTGVYIPVDVLARFVPELASVEFESGRTPIAAPTGEQMLRLRLCDNLHRLDRVPQHNAFRGRFAPALPKAGNSFVCLIAGTADDLPAECRVRFEREVRAAAGGRSTTAIAAPEPASPQQDLAPQPLPWPTQRQFDPARALQALVRSLHIRLSAQKPPFDEAIRTVLNDEITPLLYYSEVKAADFNRDDRLLLGLWLDLLDTLNRAPLAQPFVHFLMFQFEEDTRPADPDLDQDLEAQLNALLVAKRDRSILETLFRRPVEEPLVLDDRASFERLPALGLVGFEDTKAWVKSVAAGLRPQPDEVSVGAVRDALMEEFDSGGFAVRMKRIEWRSRYRDGKGKSG